MELKQGYKQTEIGVIPEDWHVRKFREVFKLKYGKSQFGINKTDGLYPIVGTSGIVGNTDSFLYNYPSVLIGRKGTIDKPQYFENPFWAIDTVFYTEININFNPKFVFYKCNLINWLSFNEASGVPSLNTTTIENISLSYPSKEEQAAIAQVLSDTDELISSLEKLIAKKRLIKQGTMQQLLTGKKRLPGFIERWECYKLGEITEIIMGQSPSSTYYNYENKGLPLIQGNADLENRKSISRIWTSQITKTCDANGIIMTVRAPVGLIGIATNKSCIGRGVCYIRTKNIIKQFLYHLMIFNESKWKILEQGSTFTAANSNQIKQFEIKIPMSLKEQIAVAEILDNIDSEIDALEQKLNKYKSIKQGMMQELLTGKTRLV